MLLNQNNTYIWNIPKSGVVSRKEERYYLPEIKKLVGDEIFDKL